MISALFIAIADITRVEIAVGIYHFICRGLILIVTEHYHTALDADFTRSGLINIFQPDILCIGGGVCNEGDPLLLPLKELVAKEIYTKNSEKNTEIVIAKLGNDAGIIGAAFLGLNKER